MGNFRIEFNDIVDGVRGQPGRAGLSVLAIAVGTVALTLLLAALGGLREKARHMVEEFGVNVIAVVSENHPQRPAMTGILTERHADLLAKNLSSCRASTARFFSPSQSDQHDLLRIVATDGAMNDVRGWRLLRGRFLDDGDLRGFARNAVIASDLSAFPGWDLGQVVRLKDTPFTIVGIVATGAGSLDADDAAAASLSGRRAVFVPRTTARQWLDASGANAHAVDAVFIRAPDGMDLGAAQARAQRILGAPDAACPDCSWITPERLLAGVHRMESAILLTIGTVSLLCLALGGATLAALMVAGVRDRIPEIGLRRSLGASPRDIASLFVVEGLLVAAVGAISGVLLSHIFLLLTQSILPCPIRLGMVTLTVPILLSLLVGGLASYRPAMTAAQIAPAEALRNE